MTTCKNIYTSIGFLSGYFMTQGKLIATPSSPTLPKDPWKQEVKVTFNSLKTENQIHSGFSLSYRIEQSKFHAGIAARTNPYEPLNRISQTQFFVRYHSNKTTWVAGQYAIKLGTGIVKDVGTPSYLNNAAWASKSEEWNVKENRSLSRRFPVHGIAVKYQHSPNRQFIFASGLAKFYNPTFSKATAYSTFYISNTTLAYRYATRNLSRGVALNHYLFSKPWSVNQAPAFYAAPWLRADTGNSYVIRTVVYPEFWISQTLNNGSLWYGNWVFQIHSLNNPSLKPVSNALKVGLLIPISKLSDWGIRFQSVGRNFFSMENVEVPSWINKREIQVGFQEQVTPRTHWSVMGVMQQTRKAQTFETLALNPWSKSVQLKFQHQYTTFSIRSSCRIKHKSSISNDFFSEENFENTFQPEDVNAYNSLWQHQYSNYSLFSHVSFESKFNSNISGECHLYNQTQNQNNGTCLSFALNKAWHSTVISQSGLALYHVPSPMVVQGLQLGNINHFQIVNGRGVMLFCGFKNKLDNKLTQILQLQIMQNFSPKRQLSARIFAVIWLR